MKASRTEFASGAAMYAFVLMPFDVAFDDIYKLGIKETAEKQAS